MKKFIKKLTEMSMYFGAAIISLAILAGVVFTWGPKLEARFYPVIDATFDNIYIDNGRLIYDQIITKHRNCIVQSVNSYWLYSAGGLDDVSVFDLETGELLVATTRLGASDTIVLPTIFSPIPDIAIANINSTIIYRKVYHYDCHGLWDTLQIFDIHFDQVLEGSPAGTLENEIQLRRIED